MIISYNLGRLWQKNNKFNKKKDIDLLVNDYYFFKSITGARSNNKRNKTKNTSQPHPGFLTPDGDKGENTRKGKGGEYDKDIPTKKKNVPYV